MGIKFERRYGFSDEACAEIQKKWPTDLADPCERRFERRYRFFEILQYFKVNLIVK